MYDNLTQQLAKRELIYDKVMIVITGITGSGKTTIFDELQTVTSSY